MKTIREWLEELPEPYRTQALENVNEHDPKIIDELPSEQTAKKALSGAFVWMFTEQGERYWFDLYRTL